MQLDQLRTLLAVVDEGSFERAAGRLHVTGSAVSQRVKTLEEFVGQVLVHRGSPCTPTPAGARVLTMARQVAILETETLAALRDGGPRIPLPVAVNADSLATWFPAVFDEAARWDDALLRLEVEDQDHSADLLRAGAVLAAVTADPAPVSGCSTELLGVMRYRAVATPALLERHEDPHRPGVPDWSTLPMVRFNRKDGLQDEVLRVLGVHDAPVVQVPSSQGFLAAVRAGLGWGLLPDLQLGAEPHGRPLVALPQCPPRDIPLHWQVWRLRSDAVRRLTRAVRAAALTLRPGPA